MITTMDKAGRVVVPKVVREALGLPAGGEIEIAVDDDGRAVLSAAPVAKRLETRDGMPVIVPQQPLPPLTADQLRATLESVRR